jgi:hypothetical protein
VLVLANVGATLGGIAAGIAIVGFVVEVVLKPIRRAWRRLTRRGRLAATLRSLACGVQTSSFTEALGKNPTHRAAEAGGASYLWVLKDVYVTAATDRHDNVTSFAITTRARRFKPSLRMAGIEVVLGRTTYSELPDMVNGLLAWYGARRHSYAESYYFGNPGFYQSWVAASNDAGAHGAGSLDGVIRALGGTEVVALGRLQDWGEGGPPEMPICWYTRPAVAEFRASTPINTLVVSGPHLPPNPSLGPDLDHVRTLST